MTKKNKSDDSWWKHGIIYHIYPMSFNDSNNDGIGDLKGIIQKLDYLTSLNITAIWLSPIYKSPQIDMGYDISDYCAIDPMFGTMDDFNELLSQCHSRGIRVIMDLIMNHTSDQHPWFIESRSSYDNPKRDWYIWNNGIKNKPINNWKSAYGGSAWEYDAQTKSYYMHSFFKEQPDLNWRCKAMAKEFFKTVDFWLKKGVDGFRLDVINVIAKDQQFRSNPLFLNIPFIHKNIYNRNRSKSLDVVESLRRHIDTYPNRMLVGEIFVMPPGSRKTVLKFVRTDKGNPRLNLAFDFSMIFRPFSALSFFKYAKKWNDNLEKADWACHVFSNHDLGREYNRRWFRTNKIQKAKLISLFQFTLKGTPFLYYGEEIAMRNITIPKKQIRDPLGQRFWPFYTGRDKCRTPMQWDDSIHAGFSEIKPWLPIDRQKDFRCVKNQELDDTSMLNHYKTLISLRNKHKELTHGTWIPWVKGENGILAFYRIYRNEKMLIVLNFHNKQNITFLPNSERFQPLYSTNQRESNEIHSKTLIINKLEGIILKEIKN